VAVMAIPASRGADRGDDAGRGIGADGVGRADDRGQLGERNGHGGGGIKPAPSILQAIEQRRLDALAQRVG
jgi:hypothetical protein